MKIIKFIIGVIIVLGIIIGFPILLIYMDEKEQDKLNSNDLL